MSKSIFSLTLIAMFCVSFVQASLSDTGVGSLSSTTGRRTLAQRNISITPDDSSQKAIKERYAVVIGIGNYRDKRIPALRFAVNDAQSIYGVLVDPKYGGFRKENVKILTDMDATQENIKRSIGKWLRNRAKVDDLVIVYYAGHGAVEEDETYWVSYDSDIDDLFSTALSSEDVARLFHRVKAKRMVAFLDSCYSAATVHRTGGRRDIITEDPFAKFKGRGRVTITSSDGKEQSLELNELGHGVFTYYLIQALKGKADTNKDGAVLLDEVWGYLKDRVTQRALKHGSSQTPIIDGTFSAGFILSKNPEVMASNEKRLVALSALLGGRRITVEEYREAERLLMGNIQTNVDESLLTFVQLLCDGELTTEEYRKNRRRIMALAEKGRKTYASPEPISPQPMAKPVEPETLEAEKVEVSAVAPRPEELEGVRIGLLTSGTGLGKYVRYLMDEIRKKPNREIVQLLERINYHNLDVDRARILRQRHKIDMLIGVTNYWQSGRGYHGDTKLIDLLTQRVIELEPVDTGHLQLSPGWERKLIRKQIRPIEEMIDEIYAEKTGKRVEERMKSTATIPKPEELQKVLIGVLTKLDRGYFIHLNQVLGMRTDCQVLEILDPISYDALDEDMAKMLGQKHQIDMFICVTYRDKYPNALALTKLIDISGEKLVKLAGIAIGPYVQPFPYGWEKRLVKKQIGPIEKMIDQIAQEKKKSKP